MSVLLTRAEAAKRLRRSDEALRKLIRRDQKVRQFFCKIGGRVFISEENFEALIEAMRLKAVVRPSVQIGKSAPPPSEIKRRLRQLAHEARA